MQFVAVAAGAVLGANLRYLVGIWAADNWPADFPYATFVVNLSGSLVIGIVLAFLTTHLGVSALWRLFLVVGFLGGYTTFSSYTWEAFTLADQGDWLRAWAYVLGSNALGFLGVWLGVTLARQTPF